MTNVVQEYIVGDGIYDKVTHHSDTHYICSSKVSNGSTIPFTRSRMLLLTIIQWMKRLRANCICILYIFTKKLGLGGLSFRQR